MVYVLDPADYILILFYNFYVSIRVLNIFQRAIRNWSFDLESTKYILFIFWDME